MPPTPNVSRRSLARAAVVTAALTTSLASAQNAPSTAEPASEPLQLNEFQVSASKDRGYRASNSISGARIDTPIKDLPFALQAFTEDFITDQRPTSIFDIARYAPSVTYRSNDFNEGNVNVSIRGFAAGTIFRDGMRGPQIIDFTNISRLEVVKGPASFLYGQLAPGGIINVLTKQPQQKAATTVRASYGSYDSYRAEFDTTGPIGGTLSYRLATSYDHDIEYWKPYDAHSYNLAPTLRCQPVDTLSLTVAYERYRKREEPQVMQKPGWGNAAGILATATDPNYSGLEVPGLPDDWNSMADIDYRHSDVDLFTATVNVKAGEHWSFRGAYTHDRSWIDANFSGNLGVSNGAFIQGRRFRGQTYEYEGDNLQAEGVGKYQVGGMSLRLLVGAELKYYDFNTWAAQAPNDPALGNNPATPLPAWDLRNPATWNRTVTLTRAQQTSGPGAGASESEDQSVYAGLTAGLIEDRLLLLGGARFTRTTNNFTNLITGAANPEFSSEETTPQVGALFKLTRSLSAFASYSESFVPNPRLLNVRNVPTSAAQPTTGTGYDVGLKADLYDGRLSGTVSLFEVTNENIITDISDFDAASGGQLFTNIQSGEQRSRGVELDVTLSPTDRWQVYVSGSYMDSEIVRLTDNDAAILALDPNNLNPAQVTNYKLVTRFLGRPLQMAARWQANLWTRYNFSDAGRDGFFVAAGFNYIGDQTLLSDTPEQYWQTYTLYNALVGYALTWSGRPVTFELNGKNLTDEYYRPSQSSRARPREIVFSISTKF